MIRGVLKSSTLGMKSAAPARSAPILAGAAQIYSFLKCEAPGYSHLFSPKKFTRAQLCAICCWRRATGSSLRRAIAELRGSYPLRKAFELRTVPDFSTLWHAERRLSAIIRACLNAHRLDGTRGPGEAAPEIQEPLVTPGTACGAVHASALTALSGSLPCCRAGDVWEIGGVHRLGVGDCRDHLTCETLVREAQVDCVITSPPYGGAREYDPTSGFTPISPDEYVKWFEPVQAAIRRVLAPNGSLFVTLKAGCASGERMLYAMDLVLAMKRRWGWRYIDEIIWKRKGPPGRWAYRLRNDFEPVYHFSNGSPSVRHAAISYPTDEAPAKPDLDARHDGSWSAHWNRGSRKVPGVAHRGNVFEAGVTNQQDDHPAAFPVTLPAFLISAFTDPGQGVFDPFTGSGSTLLAAARSGRRFLGMELSPKYARIALVRAEAAGLSSRRIELAVGTTA